jgi:hypothetical protein
MTPGLGIDFGGVIAERTGAGEDHPAGLDPQAVHPVPNAFSVIAEMNELLRDRVWIVSKSTPGTQRMTREWLKYHRFAELTGVGVQQVHFVRDRSEKLERCREFGITHFVDDQRKTLEVLSGHVKHLYLFGGDSARSGIVGVQDWLELGGLLRQSFVAEERKES